MIPTERALSWLLERDGWWLWTSETQHEALELLTSLLPQLSADDVLRVEAKVIAGPPRRMFKAEVTFEDWAKTV